MNRIARFITVGALLVGLSLAVSLTYACQCDPEPTPFTPTPTEPIPVSPTPTPDEPLATEPAPADFTATPAPPVDMEENVSFNDSNLGVSILKSEDAEGKVQLDVFNTLNHDTDSSYLFSVTQDDIAPFMTEHPTVNTLLAAGDGVAIYVLTTGEIQINAGPDAEGKTHVKILDGIPWTRVYGYTIDPK